MIFNSSSVRQNQAGLFGVGIDHRSNIAFGKMRFQGLTQSLATIFVYVERLIFIAHNGYLLFLHGESGVDKQDGVFSRRTLSGRKERGVCALHGTGYGYATLWVYIYIYKRLDKAGSLLFHFGSSVDVRVDRRYTVTKGLRSQRLRLLERLSSPVRPFPYG